jgi:hypothetical protein
MAVPLDRSPLVQTLAQAQHRVGLNIRCALLRASVDPIAIESQQALATLAAPRPLHVAATEV